MGKEPSPHGKEFSRAKHFFENPPRGFFEEKAKEGERLAVSKDFNFAEFVIEIASEALKKAGIASYVHEKKNSRLDARGIDFTFHYNGRKIPLQVKSSKGGVAYHKSHYPDIPYIFVRCIWVSDRRKRKTERVATSVFNKGKTRPSFQDIAKNTYCCYALEIIRILQENERDFSHIFK